MGKLLIVLLSVSIEKKNRCSASLFVIVYEPTYVLCINVAKMERGK